MAVPIDIKKLKDVTWRFYSVERISCFTGNCCLHLRGTSPTLTLILNLVYFNLLKYYKNKILKPRVC